MSRASRSLEEDRFEANPEWERLHREFHRTLLAGCESPLLLEICDQLYDQAYRYRQLAAQLAHRRRHEGDEHKDIFEAVLKGDLDAARSRLAAHYERTAGFIANPALPAGISPG